MLWVEVGGCIWLLLWVVLIFGNDEGIESEDKDRNED